jgi:hypothetical protein
VNAEESDVKEDGVEIVNGSESGVVKVVDE